MDSKQFDSMVKAFGTGASRRGVLRGVTAAALGAVVAVTGSGLFADDASAGHSHKKQASKKSRSARARHLGDACKPGNPEGSGVQGDCASNENLECQFVGQTGASRCECTTGFSACGGVCVRPGSTGPIGCEAVSACECVCPAARPTECTPDGSNTAICVDTTCGGDANFTYNPDTCQCERGCATAGDVFCNGCCHTPSAVCRRNQNFNQDCCACENPGQPSGNCKNPPLACPA
jgi:hypothetical protein